MVFMSEIMSLVIFVVHLTYFADFLLASLSRLVGVVRNSSSKEVEYNI